MSAIRTPRTLKAATALLERFAEIDGQVAAIEADRNAAIAVANAAADALANPLLTDLEAIHEKLEPWWNDAAAELTKGKRKSIELGGCMIGSRAGRESLQVEGDEKAIVASLEKREWARPLLSVVVKLDRKAILKSIDGVYKKQLSALGLSRKPGAETFFVARTEQGGTLAEAAA